MLGGHLFVKFIVVKNFVILFGFQHFIYNPFSSVSSGRNRSDRSRNNGELVQHSEMSSSELEQRNGLERHNELVLHKQLGLQSELKKIDNQFPYYHKRFLSKTAKNSVGKCLEFYNNARKTKTSLN